MKIIVSHALYNTIEWGLDKAGPVANICPIVEGQMLPFGTSVERSNIFPFSTICPICSGSGEGGLEATYCVKCNGAGRTETVGVVTDRDKVAIVLTGNLDPLFAPYFPREILIPRRLCRGLP